MRDRGGFVASGDDGGDWWPGVRGFVLRSVVIEFVETPEVAVGDGQVQPNSQGDAADCEKRDLHRPFCIGWMAKG